MESAEREESWSSATAAASKKAVSRTLEEDLLRRVLDILDDDRRAERVDDVRVVRVEDQRVLHLA